MALSKRVKIKYEVDGTSAKRGLDAMAKGTEKVRKGAVDADKAVRGLGKGAGGIRGALGGVSSGLTTAATAATATVAAVAAVAIAFDQVATRAVASQIAIDNLPFAINKARGATLGLVGDLELQQQAITANRLGAAKSSEEFARLASAATKLGLSVGQDATKSVSDLTTALSRQNPQILDNLGIMLTVGEANREYAQRLGKTANALTDVERKQAFVTIGLERAEEAAAKVNIELDQTSAFILELKTESSNFASDFSRGFVGALSNASNALEELIGDISGLNRELDALDLAAGPGRFSFLNPNIADNVEKAKQVAETKRVEADNAADLLAIESELAALERQSFESDLRSLQVQIAGTSNQKELNKLLGKQASLKVALLELDGKTAEADEATFQEVIRKARVRARRRSGGRRDPNRAERLVFQRQLTEAINAERAREFSEAASLQRNYLQDVQAFENGLQSVRLAGVSRSRDAALEEERLTGLRESRLQRDTELALAKAVTEEQRFIIEQDRFVQREDALRRRIELETEVGQREQLEDDLSQVRHERTLSRLAEEKRAREQASRDISNAIRSVGEVEQGAFQLSSAVAGASIKGAERQRAALVGIEAGHLAFKGTVSMVEGGLAIAAGNFPKGLAQIAAGGAAIVKAGTLASGLGASVGGRGGASTAGTATQFGSGRPQAQRAQFTVDRGAPISVRDDVDGNPNNTTSSQSGAGRGNVVNIARIDVLGAIDDETGNKIRKGLQRSEANLG